jgi:23S rRNA A1618 N6-methylase RlmF
VQLFQFQNFALIRNRKLLCQKEQKHIYQAIWANNKDFDEVLISPRMIADHMPDNVLAALKKVLTP